MAKQRIISTSINGNPVEFLAAPRQTLLEVLRDTLDLIGTKEGCSKGGSAATLSKSSAATTRCPMAVQWPSMGK